MSLQTELEALLDIYVEAYRRQDAEGCAATFTPNALLVSPFGPPARGRAEIERVHMEWTAEDEAKDKVIEIAEGGGSEDCAWCLAEFSEGATGQGTSLMVFERGASGEWLLRMCSLNE